MVSRPVCKPETNHFGVDSQMSSNFAIDTESQGCFSWNVSYVFSANERMKENKQTGQIKKKSDLNERTRGNGEGVIHVPFIEFVFLCMSASL